MAEDVATTTTDDVAPNPWNEMLSAAALQYAERASLPWKRTVKVDPKGDFRYHLKREPGVLYIGQQALQDDDLVFILEEGVRQCVKADSPPAPLEDYGVELRITLRAHNDSEAVLRAKQELRECINHALDTHKFTFVDWECYGRLE